MIRKELTRKRRKQRSVWVAALLAVSLFRTISAEEPAADLLSSMTLEEKVAQMFFVTPEALTGVSPVTAAGSVTEACFEEYPVGGVIYFDQNIESREQLTSMLSRMQEISEQRLGIPVFLAVDEEGGRVTRVYGSGVSDIPYVEDMYSVGSSGDAGQAYQKGVILGSYLADLNFTVDFAPVADVFSNPANAVIGDRSFGSEPGLVSEMVASAVDGLQSTGIHAALKHFPGHGDTAQDSHAGYACSYKTLEELRTCEFEPFRAGIAAGASFVMMGHISLPNVLGSDLPASLSYTMVTDVLRNEIGFDGIVLTDALNMGAIANSYSSSEAVIQAINAGVDMVLMPGDFHADYAAVLEAVYSGRLSEKRIDDAVIRILKKKMEM